MATERTFDTDAIVARVLALSADVELPRSKAKRPPDVDRIIRASVNVPFPRVIEPDELAAALRDNQVPAHFAGHLARFLEEMPTDLILRFCDRHGIAAATLARFLRTHRATLPIRNPELEEALGPVLSHS